MAIVLNGTTGITNDGGYTGDGVVFADTTPANTLVTTTGGNVGVGTSSPTSRLTIKQSADNSAAGLGARIERNSNDSFLAVGYRDNSDSWQINATYLSTGAFKPITFLTADAERARIDSAGIFCLGTTTPISGSYKMSVVGAGGIILQGTGNPWNPLVFNNSSGGLGGYVQVSGTSTSYITTSDYRLKENIQPMTGALQKVQALKPVTYKWKIDGSDGQGFIAHELSEVEPSCVAGEKDAVDEEGKPQYQGIDTSFLVATLTAAIQELHAIVDAQGAEIAALDARLTSLKGTA